VPDVLQITDVRLHPAGTVARRRGVLGHLTCEVNGALLLGLKLRRSEAGRLYLAYPHQWDRGRERHVVRPVHDAARRTIEAQVLAELRRRGEIPE
jgi:DNA-binding cell septation regulator SpoVG